MSAADPLARSSVGLRKAVPSRPVHLHAEEVAHSRVVVSAIGELDEEGADLLDRSLHGIEHRTVLLDLRLVGLFGAAAAAVIATAAQRAMVCVRPSTSVGRTLEICGLEHLIAASDLGERLRLNDAPAGIVLLDDHLRVVYANRSFADRVRLRPVELLGVAASELPGVGGRFAAVASGALVRRSPEEYVERTADAQRLGGCRRVSFFPVASDLLIRGDGVAVVMADGSVVAPVGRR